MAPAGVANINGTKIYTELFHISVSNFKKYLPALNDKMRSSLRNMFSEVKAVIIDKISIIHDLLFHNYLRLLELFGQNQLMTSIMIVDNI